jgi:protoporphyrinogen oxidase
MSDLNQKVVIAGAGIAGLSAAIYLKRVGYTNITLIESSDRPGGRLKTDKIDGFILNQGFNLVNNQYKYLSEVVDLGALGLKYLDSGALIMEKGNIRKITAPFKRTFFVPRILFSDLGSFKDKVRLIKKRIELDQSNEEEIFEKYELRSASYLRKKGFSSKIIHDFFKPYFSAFMKEEELSSSRRFFDYIFSIHVKGKNGIPSEGTEFIIKQILSELNSETFIYNTSVSDFVNNEVVLSNGNRIECDIFIIATEQTGLLNKLKPLVREQPHRSTTCIYFSADKKPFKDALICINANNPKLINNVVVLTNISDRFAPKNKQLVCVTLNGMAKADDSAIENEAKAELLKAFGDQVNTWKLLKIYRTEYALPNQDSVFGKRRILELRLDKNVYVCGDHLLYGTMDAAVKSGKMVAELIGRDHNKDHVLEKRQKYSNLFS